MRRLIVVGLVIALPAVVAGQVAAKEPVRAKVCGASDCVDVKDRSLLFAMVDGGPPGPPPRSGAPWYRATIVIDADGQRESFSLAVVPRRGYVRSRPDGAFVWMRIPESGQVAWRRVTSGLEARPAADLRGLDTPAPGTAAAARVDEVVEPPADSASSASSDSPAWPWIATAAAGIGLIGIVAAWLRRRRRRGGTATPPGPAPETP
jgi:MYXO-CTERM domain-containing protein